MKKFWKSNPDWMKRLACLIVILVMSGFTVFLANSKEYLDGIPTFDLPTGAEVNLADNTSFNFGTDDDWEALYNTTTTSMVFRTTAINGSADDIAMFQIQANDAGGTLDDEQRVFGIYDNATELFAVDEDGDVTASGVVLATGDVVAIGGVIAGTTVNPDTADGAALGTSALEWSDLFLADDGIAYFGTDEDWDALYETTTASMVFRTTATNGSSDDAAMFQIQANDAGGTLDDEQQVFEILDNTTEVFSVDEDGDATCSGVMTASGGVEVARTTTPGFSGQDSDCTDSDDNFKIYGNATGTGSGAEDIDVFYQAQRAGTMATQFETDANGGQVAGTSEVDFKGNDITDAVIVDVATLFIEQANLDEPPPGNETTRDQVTYRDFADDATNSVVHLWQVPEDIYEATANEVKVRVLAIISNATAPGSAEGVSWDISACSSGDDDPFSCTLGTGVNSEDADIDSQVQWDYVITPWTAIVITDLAAGEFVKFRWYRDVDDSDDDYGQDIGGVALQVKYFRKLGSVTY